MINLSKPSNGTLIVISVESELEGSRWKHRVNQLITNGHLARDIKTMAVLLSGISDSWTETTDIASPVFSQDAAREMLSKEWNLYSPKTPDEIASFYKTSKFIGNDLEAWHSTPERQRWTEIVVEVAQQTGTEIAVDIGCGAGHELIALHHAGIRELYGVEPNDKLRKQVQMHTPCVATIEEDQIPIEQADLLVCLDVLEHVVDPETFLGKIADWAKFDCVLVESTATFDHGTPLHLESNYGWHATNCLESRGWELIEASNRVRIWQKMDKR